MKRFIVYALVAGVSAGGVFILGTLLTEDNNSDSKAEQSEKVATPLTLHDRNYTLDISQNIKKLYTNSEEVTFHGQVADTSSTVSINDQQLDIGKDGGFKSAKLMHPGENVFVFVCENLHSGKREEKTFRWIVDKYSPEFRLTKPLPGTDMPYAHSEIDVGGEFFLPDTDIDIEEGVSVLVNSKEMVISDDRRGFSGSIQLPDGQHELRVVAIDPAGNKAETTLSLLVDTTSPVVTVHDFRISSEEGVGPLIRFFGSVNEPADLRFDGRPIGINEKGDFQFEIYAFDLEDVQRKSKAVFTATDSAGNAGYVKLPRGGDLLPPHWIELHQLSLTQSGAILEGKLSEPDATVHIGDVDATADSDGVVRIEGIEFDQKYPIVKTVLEDQAGNTSHIEQWISVHPENN